MKLKLAKRMQKARKRELDRTRADLARVDKTIRSLELQLEQTRNEVRALHASSDLKSSELELGHLRCKSLEQELHKQHSLRNTAQALLIEKYHHKERGEKVLERVKEAHEQTLLTQEQRCNDDRSPEHLKKLA